MDSEPNANWSQERNELFACLSTTDDIPASQLRELALRAGYTELAIALPYTDYTQKEEDERNVVALDKENRYGFTPGTYDALRITRKVVAMQEPTPEDMNDPRRENIIGQIDWAREYKGLLMKTSGREVFALDSWVERNGQIMWRLNTRNEFDQPGFYTKDQIIAWGKGDTDSSILKANG